MSLNARQGENLVLKIDGPDEKQAAGFLNGLLRTIYNKISLSAQM